MVEKKYFTELERIAARKACQKRYYQNKGKATRSKYYQANIEEKREVNRLYQRKRRELLHKCKTIFANNN